MWNCPPCETCTSVRGRVIMWDCSPCETCTSVSGLAPHRGGSLPPLTCSSVPPPFLRHTWILRGELAVAALEDQLLGQSGLCSSCTCVGREEGREGGGGDDAFSTFTPLFTVHSHLFSQRFFGCKGHLFECVLRLGLADFAKVFSGEASLVSPLRSHMEMSSIGLDHIREQFFRFSDSSTWSCLNQRDHR